MTPAEWTNLARLGVGTAGVLTLGQFREVHVILALVLVGLWLYYVATTDPRRAAVLYVLGTAAGLVVKEAVR